MRLTYIYHSGFAIEADEFAILIDYYKDTGRSPEKGFVHEKLLNRAGILYVLSSHFHPDHFNPDVLKWKEIKSDIKYIFSKDILKSHRAKGTGQGKKMQSISKKKILMKIITCGSRHSDQQTPAYPS